jgi:hypothetical protein
MKRKKADEKVAQIGNAVHVDVADALALTSIDIAASLFLLYRPPGRHAITALGYHRAGHFSPSGVFQASGRRAILR